MRSITTLTLLTALVAASPAAASPVVASGSDPLAGICDPRVDSGVPVEQGFDTHDTATGPAVAVDPRDPKRILVAWNQDFPQAIGVAVSRDGGRTWRRGLVPGLSRCTGGPRLDAYDPAVAITADGALLVASVPADEPRVPVPAVLLTELAVSRSTDDGETWSAPVIVEPSTGFSAAEPSLSADPQDPRDVVATWVHKSGPGGTTGEIHSARSHDGGRTWSKPATAYRPPGSDVIASGNALVRRPNGDLVLVGHTWGFSAYAPIIFGLASAQGTPATRFPVWSVRSTDGGATWSAPVSLGETLSPLPQHPESGTTLNIYNLPSATVDARGVIRATWHSIRSDRLGELLLASSRDGGRTWSAPRALPRSSSAQVFSPQIAATQNGRLALTWYDARRDVRGDPAFTLEVRSAVSRNGGRSWRERRLAGPFDALKLPVYREFGSRLLWLGFYQGHASGRRRTTAAFTLPAAGTRAAVHVARLGGGGRSRGHLGR